MGGEVERGCRRARGREARGGRGRGRRTVLRRAEEVGEGAEDGEDGEGVEFWFLGGGGGFGEGSVVGWAHFWRKKTLGCGFRGKWERFYNKGFRVVELYGNW